MSAQTLRRAADAIRESVEIAASQPATDAVVRGVWLNSRYHVVLSTPTALAVADLLDKEAEGVESGNWRPCVDPALTVARAYLGSDA